jgi:hypothetical protein
MVTFCRPQPAATFGIEILDRVQFADRAGNAVATRKQLLGHVTTEAAGSAKSTSGALVAARRKGNDTRSLDITKCWYETRRQLKVAQMVRGKPATMHVAGSMVRLIAKNFLLAQTRM